MRCNLVRACATAQLPVRVACLHASSQGKRELEVVVAVTDSVADQATTERRRKEDGGKRHGTDIIYF